MVYSHYQPVATSHNYGYEYFLTWTTREADKNADMWSRGVYRKPSQHTLALAKQIAQRNNRKLLEEAMRRTDGYYKNIAQMKNRWFVQEQMEDESQKVFEYDFTENAEYNRKLKAKMEAP